MGKIEKQLPAPRGGNVAERGTLMLDFGEFLPSGLFERLVAIAIQYSMSGAFEDSRDPILVPDDVLLSFGEWDCRTSELTAQRRIRVVVDDEVSGRPIAENLMEMLDSLN